MSTQFTNRQWRLPNNENKDKQSNYSMDFDGSSQYLDTPQIDLGSTNSISFWINRTSTAQGTLFGDPNGSSNYSLFIIPSTNNIYFRLGNGDSGYWQLTVSSGLLNDGNWHHHCLTRNGVTLSYYIDGVLQTNVVNNTLNASAGTNTTIENIMAKSDGTLPLSGKLDGISLFNYALSSSQITTLYGSSSTGIGNPMSLSPKPVAYYPLGDQDAFNGANYLVPNSSLKDYVFDFDGNDDYISLNTTQTFNTEFTISLWLNPNDVTEVNLLGNSSDISNFLYINASSELQINSPNFSAQAFTNTTFSIGSWQHVILTRDSNNIFRAYKNGNLLDTSSAVSGAFSFNQIGRYGAVSTYIFNGKVSNVQIFNTALPATGSNSIETLYNNGSPLTSMSGFTSLQGWWKLDASATYDGTNWTIPDDSSNSNDGTSYGMTQANLVQSDLSFTSNYSPYALDFDKASNDYISLPNSTDYIYSNNDFTFSVWFYKTVTTTTTIFSKGSAVNGQHLLFFFPSTNTLRADFYNSGATGDFSYIFDNDKWYHVALCRSGSNVTLYVNGGSAETITPTYANGNITSANTYIGKYYAQTIRDWGGKLSNCSVWNTALTSAQVTELYSEGIPQNLLNHSAVSSLVSWWQLGSNSSFNTNWTVLDEKGSNNGTSVNMNEDDIVDGVGSYANGLSSGMGGDEVIGDAPYSTANSLSVNMDVLDRVEDTPA